MADRVCRECAGPLDILHTATECANIQQAVDVPDTHRYQLATVAAIINGAPSSVAAAHRLYAAGLLRPPRIAS